MARGDAWLNLLNADPRPWLLEESAPAVRAAALVRLLERSPDEPEVVRARAAAMRTDPIRGILAAQDPAGWWVKPGPGYAPKYTGTVWNLIFLEQLGADPADKGVQAACRYVLRWCPTAAGGFGCSGSHLERNPPPSSAIHCLNGNLLRALIRFGYLDDPRTRAAVDWAARTILGEDVERWYAATPGPGFACGANDRLPCAWGAVKQLRALAAIPPRRRSTRVRRAVEAGVEFLFSRDPADADYPMGYGNARPSSSWFKLGFPSGYVADVLQVLKVLTGVGPRPRPAPREGAGLAHHRAGRPGALEQPLRLCGQDHGAHRSPGQALQMGHPAGVQRAAGRVRLSGPPGERAAAARLCPGDARLSHRPEGHVLRADLTGGDHLHQ